MLEIANYWTVSHAPTHNFHKRAQLHCPALPCAARTRRTAVGARVPSRLHETTHATRHQRPQQQPPDRAVGSSSTTNKLPLKPAPLLLPGRFEALRVSRRRLAMLAKTSLMPRPDLAEVSKYCAPTATA